MIKNGSFPSFSHLCSCRMMKIAPWCYLVKIRKINETAFIYNFHFQQNTLNNTFTSLYTEPSTCWLLLQVPACYYSEYLLLLRVPVSTDSTSFGLLHIPLNSVGYSRAGDDSVMRSRTDSSYQIQHAKQNVHGLLFST